MATSDSWQRVRVALRIFHAGPQHAAIESAIGMPGSYSHRKGDPTILKSRPASSDQWNLNTPLGAESTLDDQLIWLWNVVSSKLDFFFGLIEHGAELNLAIGYRSESDQGGFALSASALKGFVDLGVDIDVFVTIS